MIKKLFSSQLRINMVSGVATTVLNTLVLAVGYPVYLHFLGYEQYGLWLILTTVLTFAQLGNLGIGRALTKLVAEEYGRHDLQGIQQYVTAALTVLILSGAVVLGVILSLRVPIVSLFGLSDQNEKAVLWLLPYVGCLSVYVFLVQAINGTLSGLGRMDLANWTQSLGRMVAVATSAFFLWRGRGIESLLIGSTLSYVLVHIINVFSIRRVISAPLLRPPRWRDGYYVRLLRFSLSLVGGSVLSMLISPFNKLMLSRYAGVSTIPIYDIACNGGMQARSLIEMGLRPLMPEVSRVQGSMIANGRDRVRRIHYRAMQVVFGLGVPLYGMLMLLATPLLKIWLRDSFVAGLPRVFRIMLVATFLSLIGIPAFHTLVGLGMVRYTLLGYLIESFASAIIVVTLFFVWQERSVEAVAIALLVAMGINTAYLTVVRIRRV